MATTDSTEPTPSSLVANLDPISTVFDTEIEAGSLSFGFTIPPGLSESELSCKPPGDNLVVAGPFVSPTITFPSLCNGVPCKSALCHLWIWID